MPDLVYSTPIKAFTTTSSSSKAVVTDSKKHPDDTAKDGNISEMQDLAKAFSDAGDHQKSAEVRTEILEANRRDLGEEHPQTFLAMFLLA